MLEEQKTIYSNGRFAATPDKNGNAVIVMDYRSTDAVDIGTWPGGIRREEFDWLCEIAEKAIQRTQQRDRANRTWDNFEEGMGN